MITERKHICITLLIRLTCWRTCIGLNIIPWEVKDYQKQKLRTANLLKVIHGSQRPGKFEEVFTILILRWIWAVFCYKTCQRNLSELEGWPEESCMDVYISYENINQIHIEKGVVCLVQALLIRNSRGFLLDGPVVWPNPTILKNSEEFFKRYFSFHSFCDFQVFSKMVKINQHMGVLPEWTLKLSCHHAPFQSFWALVSFPRKEPKIINKCSKKKHRK